MAASSFKTVGWAAGVAAAALGCYMMSLQVATERAELAKVERRIIAAQQDIRRLQTELGTRGRLSQLERWNADILALSAPAAGQFIENEMVLARFDQTERGISERAGEVRLASAPASPAAAAPAPILAAAPSQAPAAPALARAAAAPDYAAARARTEQEDREAQQAAVRRAALVVPEGRPLEDKAKPAVSKASFLDEKLVQELSAAAKAAKAESQGN